MRVGKTEERSRVDADKFNQKSGRTSKDQIGAKYFDPGRRASGCLLPHMPQECRDGYPNEKFIDGSGVTAAVGRPAPLDAGFGRRNHAVRKGHPPRPRPRRGPAVVAVTGEQAANAPDGVPNRCCRRAQVHEFKRWNLKMLRQKQKRDEPAKKSAEPGKSIAAERFGWHRRRVVKNRMGVFAYSYHIPRD